MIKITILVCIIASIFFAQSCSMAKSKAVDLKDRDGNVQSKLEDVRDDVDSSDGCFICLTN